MPQQQKPIVTELALADALDRLVNLIEELRADADLHVEITTDETDLVKLAFSATPSIGFPLRREVRDILGKIIRRVWNEGLRESLQRCVIPNDAGLPSLLVAVQQDDPLKRDTKTRALSHVPIPLLGGASAIRVLHSRSPGGTARASGW